LPHAMTDLVNVDLFGGAIKANYPEGFFDASSIRQIPDTQEVYLSRNSDDSIIIEILERVPASDSDGAARFHFEAIADDNDAPSSSVDEVDKIPYNRCDEIPSIIVLRGRQGVKKFNRTSVDDLRIFVALYRLEERGVDIVLSLNFPMNIGDGVFRTEEQYNTAKETFLSIATSFHIDDFSLFG